MSNELLDVANKINTEREALIKRARDMQQEIQNEMEKLKALEKATFGMCDGESLSVANLVVLMHKIKDHA